MKLCAINVLDSSERHFSSKLDRLTSWQSISDNDVESVVDEIIFEVKKRGDSALLEYTKLYDGLICENSEELVVHQHQLDKILNYNDLVLVKDRNGKDIFNAFICCIPKHPFIKFCIDELCYKINNFEYGDNPLDFSGPSFIGKMFEKWNNNDNVFFLYHSNNGKNIVTKENKSIIETKNGPLLFESKYNKNRICAFRKEFTSSIHNEIESYHYDILWEDRKVFFNIYYDSWSKTAKDYHIKDGYLYCRLKDLSGNWIENRKKILPFTKYCNINGQIQEE